MDQRYYLQKYKPRHRDWFGVGDDAAARVDSRNCPNAGRVGPGQKLLAEWAPAGYWPEPPETGLNHRRLA